MGRPMMNPNARFSDVKPIWDYAMANNGIVWTCESTNHAIRIIMRLNTYRRALRDRAPDGYIVEDLYTVSKIDNVITIKRRPEPRGFMTTLDGRQPLSPNQAQQQFTERLADHDPSPIDPNKPLDLE